MFVVPHDHDLFKSSFDFSLGALYGLRAVSNLFEQIYPIVYRHARLFLFDGWEMPSTLALYDT